MSERTIDTARATVRVTRAVGAVVAAAALVVIGSPIVRAAAATSADQVTMTVTDVRPNSPALGDKARRVTVSLDLVNNTAKALTKVTIVADRSDPLASQTQLDQMLAHPRAPDPNQVAHVDAAAVRVDIPADGETQTEFSFTANDISGVGHAAMCLCANAIYPLYFTAARRGTVLAHAQTYLPSFSTDTPAKVQVGWVWPLLDRPHRLTGETTFLDDGLASEVAPGGRLDRLLQVLEDVGSRVPLTIVTDPDLLDELQVMSTEKYRVEVTGTARTFAGTGAAAATAWLQRLRDVLSANPDIELDFTAPGDPNVDALVRHGLTADAQLSAEAQARVTTALGGRSVPDDIAWPVGGTLRRSTLAALAAAGTSTVLLADRSLPDGTSTDDALAPLHTPTGEITAALTSSTIERYAQQVLQRGPTGLAELPELVAQVAIRAVQSTNNGAGNSHFVVISPNRDLDPNPSVAARAILATADTPWSEPLALRAATQSVTPVDHGRLATGDAGVALPTGTVSGLRSLSRSLPALRSLIALPADRAALIGAMPIAAQRAASASLADDPDQSTRDAQILALRARRLLAGVHLVTPAGNRTYTLTSSESSLPVTVTNTLAVRVRVRLRLQALGGVPGLSVGPLPVQTIQPGRTDQVALHAQVNRTGRLEVQIGLSTPNGATLGEPVSLTVRSTALGTIGVVITTVAGVVLVLLLLLRLAGRLRRLRRDRAKAASRQPAAVT